MVTPFFRSLNRFISQIFCEFSCAIAPRSSFLSKIDSGFTLPLPLFGNAVLSEFSTNPAASSFRLVLPFLAILLSSLHLRTFLLRQLFCSLPRSLVFLRSCARFWPLPCRLFAHDFGHYFDDWFVTSPVQHLAWYCTLICAGHFDGIKKDRTSPRYGPSTWLFFLLA